MIVRIPAARSFWMNASCGRVDVLAGGMFSKYQSDPVLWKPVW
jgi:hypothetical protein